MSNIEVKGDLVQMLFTAHRGTYLYPTYAPPRPLKWSVIVIVIIIIFFIIVTINTFPSIHGENNTAVIHHVYAISVYMHF